MSAILPEHAWALVVVGILIIPFIAAEVRDWRRERRGRR